MNEIIKLIDKTYTKNEIQERMIQLNKLYTPTVDEVKISTWLNWYFGSRINGMQEKIIHPKQTLSELFTRYYPSEKIIKHAFVRYIRNKGVIVFELPIEESRVDVSCFNKYSYAFEIKTEFDVLKRLKKQINDYSKVFDYVSVVVAETYFVRAIKEIPIWCGVYVYKHKLGNLKIKFSEIRKPIRNKVNAKLQLENLTKADDHMILQKKEKEIPISKNQMIDEILLRFSDSQIRHDFIGIVKNKYSPKWEFVFSNFDTIPPIDIQFVFSTS